MQEDDDYDMFAKLRPFSSKRQRPPAAGRIPWFRGQSFSFSSVSGDLDPDALEGSTSSSYHYAPSSSGPRNSLLRSSLASSKYYTSSGAPISTVDPDAVYHISARISNNSTCSGAAIDVNSIALSANGSVALVGYSDGRVGIVHTADGARGDFTQHTSGKAIRQVAISADGMVGASASLDGTVRIFETDTLIQLALLRQTGFAWANGVALSADGRVVIAAFTPRDSDRGKIVRYDWAERRVIALWAGFSKVFEVAVDKHAEKIAFIRQGGSVCILAAAPTDTTPTANSNNIPAHVAPPAITATYKYMKGDLDMAMDAQGNNIIIIDKTLRFHRIRSNCSDLVPEYKPPKVRKIAITADASRSAEIKKSLVLIRALSANSPQSGKIVLALRHKHKLSQVNISADGTTIVCADIYSNLVLWRPDTLPKTNTNLVENTPHRKVDSSDLRDIRSCLSDANLSPIARYRPSSPAPPSPISPVSHSPNNPVSSPIIPPSYQYTEQQPLTLPPRNLNIDMTPQRPLATLDPLPLEVVSMKGGISIAPSPSPTPPQTERRTRPWQNIDNNNNNHTITKIESASPIVDTSAMNAALFALSDAFTSVETAVPYDLSAEARANNNKNNDNDNEVDELGVNMGENLFLSVESVQLAADDDGNINNNNNNIRRRRRKISISISIWAPWNSKE